MDIVIVHQVSSGRGRETTLLRDSELSVKMELTDSDLD